MTEDEQNTEPFGVFKPSLLNSFLIDLCRYTFLGRGKFRSLMSEMIIGQHGSIFDVSLWGAKVRLHPTDNVCDRKLLFAPNIYNRKELSILSEELNKENTVFLDIGANTGAYSFNIALHSTKKLNIYAFEPNPIMLSRLNAKFFENDNEALVSNINLKIFPYALGAAEEKANLKYSRRNLGEGSLDYKNSDVASDHSIEVEIKRLPDVIKQQNIKKIDALKIDIEGNEDTVIKSLFEDMDPTLWPNMIIIEHANSNQWNYDCIGNAQEKGYQVIFQNNINTALKRDPL